MPTTGFSLNTLAGIWGFVQNGCHGCGAGIKKRLNTLAGIWGFVQTAKLELGSFKRQLVLIPLRAFGDSY